MKEGISRPRRLKGWSKRRPGFHERTLMYKRCGNKCFLGPNKSYPICASHTCKKNEAAIYSAYVRSREYKKGKIATRAKRLLKKFNKTRRY
jgi:hypothetical protein